MYFEDQKAILLHVPKTAGNMISSMLIDYSSDHMILRNHQDGFDRFEISGKVTPRKHATLQEYYDILGEQLYDHRVFITVRHPVDRAVSLFFSPHRGMSLKSRARIYRLLARVLGVDVNFGEREWRYTEPDFRLDKFKQLIQTVPSICDFLTVNGDLVVPELMIRQEDLRNDFEQLCNSLNLPSMWTEDRRNVGKVSSDKVQLARNDPGVWKECIRLFAKDFDLLGIEYSRS